MKKVLSVLSLMLFISMTYAQSGMFTASYVGQSDFAVGAEVSVGEVFGAVQPVVGSSVVFDLTEVVTDGFGRDETTFTYVGARYYLGEVDSGDWYVTSRLGVYNPIEDFFTGPDAWGLQLGTGLSEDGQSLEVGGFVTTEDFEEFDFGVTAGFGIGLF